MKPRTESTAKTGARLCEFLGGRGDFEGNCPLIGVVQVSIKTLMIV